MKKRNIILYVFLGFAILLTMSGAILYLVFKNDIKDDNTKNNDVLLGEWKSFQMEFLDQGDRLTAKYDTDSLYFIEDGKIRICMVFEGEDVPTCFITTYSYDSDKGYIDITKNNTYLSGKIKVTLEDNDAILIMQSQSYDGTVARAYFERQREKD